MELMGCYCVCKSLLFDPLLRKIIPVNILPHYFSESVLVLAFLISLGLPSGVFLANYVINFSTYYSYLLFTTKESKYNVVC
jgi:hypothetical protein